MKCLYCKNVECHKSITDLCVDCLRGMTEGMSTDEFFKWLSDEVTDEYRQYVLYANSLRP